MNNSRIFTVSEINASIRGLMEVQFPFVSIAGEISNLRRPLSGHCYFTLKDEKSQIRAVLFKMQQRYLSSEPADGQMVICRGRISAYEPRGEYQVIVDTIDFHGAGLMQLEYEKLKQKLAAEGLFDEGRKKKLPFFPEHVTLVTSPQGAAVHDFISVAHARFPQAKICVYPVTVQGESASGEITKAIETINEKLNTEIIVLCRGGGSIEDLWAFNREEVARAIAGSALPIVSAIGHEIDFTIADFASDLRAPTPSAAAEMILPETMALRSQVMHLQNRLARRLSSILEQLQGRVATCSQRLSSVRHPLDTLSMKLDHAATDFQRAFTTFLVTRNNALAIETKRLQRCNPMKRIDMQSQIISGLQKRLSLSVQSNLDKRNESLAKAAALLDAVSPLSTLARGYAIARKTSPDGEVITDAKQVKEGDRIDVTLHRGEMQCIIEKASASRLCNDSELEGKK